MRRWMGPDGSAGAWTATRLRVACAPSCSTVWFRMARPSSVSEGRSPAAEGRAADDGGEGVPEMQEHEEGRRQHTYGGGEGCDSEHIGGSELLAG
nr:unnamed protein product [Digitaria exilis]